jgi:hypothetical protein
MIGQMITFLLLVARVMGDTPSATNTPPRTDNGHTRTRTAPATSHAIPNPTTVSLTACGCMAVLSLSVMILCIKRPPMEETVLPRVPLMVPPPPDDGLERTVPLKQDDGMARIEGFA